MNIEKDGKKAVQNRIDILNDHIPVGYTVVEGMVIDMKWLLLGCIAGFLFGIVLKLPKLVGLGLPVLYSLVIVWIPGWSTSHPDLSNGIFFGLIGLNVLLWLIGLGQAVYDRIIERRVQRLEIAAAIRKLKQQQIAR